MENKYKAKYLEFSNKQIGGTKTLDIVILHHPITKNTKNLYELRYLGAKNSE